jgi:hypothetical protein
MSKNKEKICGYERQYEMDYHGHHRRADKRSRGDVVLAVVRQVVPGGINKKKMQGTVAATCIRMFN